MLRASAVGVGSCRSDGREGRDWLQNEARRLVGSEVVFECVHEHGRLLAEQPGKPWIFPGFSFQNCNQAERFQQPA
jgi:hypothetical protein